VVVLSTVELAGDIVRRAVGGDVTEAIVVVPAVRQSRLQWLTNEEDRARGVARDAATRLADEATARAVAAEEGDPDPLLALEDAVREHAPDQIVVVTRPEDDAGWLERRAAAEPAGVVLGVPVTRVLLGVDGSLQLG
jgi:hypothetical protein